MVIFKIEHVKPQHPLHVRFVVHLRNHHNCMMLNTLVSNVLYMIGRSKLYHVLANEAWLNYCVVVILSISLNLEWAVSWSTVQYAVYCTVSLHCWEKYGSWIWQWSLTYYTTYFMVKLQKFSFPWKESCTSYVWTAIAQLSNQAKFYTNLLKGFVYLGLKSTNLRVFMSSTNLLMKSSSPTLIYIMNTTGPRPEPWRTQLETGIHSEAAPLTL